MFSMILKTIMMIMKKKKIMCETVSEYMEMAKIQRPIQCGAWSVDHQPRSFVRNLRTTYPSLVNAFLQQGCGT